MSTGNTIESIVTRCRSWQREDLRRAAAEAEEAGDPVTAFIIHHIEAIVLADALRRQLRRKSECDTCTCGHLRMEDGRIVEKHVGGWRRTLPAEREQTGEWQRSTHLSWCPALTAPPLPVKKEASA